MFDTDGQTFGLWVLLLRSRSPSSGGGQIFSRGALEKHPDGVMVGGVTPNYCIAEIE